ncbi:MAG: hypothetical protein JNK87_05785 [Bryobacterales bacterium]|nr:hypothetical protein [Bryobacterales bacterium]
MQSDRRTFLGALAAPTLGNPIARPALPAIRLGPHEVTRLIAGYNPIGGYSHSVPKLSAIMRSWFTEERVVEFLLNCEANGINTWQASVDSKAFAALRTARDKGCAIQWLCLMHDVEPETWREVLALKPIAVVHHGEHTDRLYRDERQSQIQSFIAKAHDAGILAGISSHVPENIARSEDAGWAHDFYMTCFYNIRRDPVELKLKLGDSPVDELYLAGDPERMTTVVRQVDRPCLGFKIFAAGRLCHNPSSITRALSYAYTHIKPRDAVIVGMFPILTDEVSENAAIARRILTGGQRGLPS